MRLTAGLDSGPVCLAATEPIRPDDTYGSLAPRLAALAGELLVRALEQAPPFAEQPSEGVTYAEKIAPGDRLLDPRRPAVELERVVRALHPHIGARAELPDGSVLGVHRAALLGEEAPVAPGGETTDAAGAVLALGVQAVAGRLLLGCDPGILELLGVQPPGGRRDGRRRLPARSRRSRAAVARDVGGWGEARREPGVRDRLSGTRVRAAARPPTPAARSPPRRPPAGRSEPSPRPRRSGSARKAVAFNSFSLGGRTSAQRPGTMCSTTASARCELLGGVLDAARAAEEHRRAVVGGVVHRRAGEHEAVEQRHGQADRRARGERPCRAPRHRAVAVDDVAAARVQRGHDERLAVLADDAEVGDQPLVEDRVDRRAVVAAALAPAPQPHALGAWRGGVGGGGHSRRAPVGCAVSDLCHSTDR